MLDDETREVTACGVECNWGTFRNRGKELVLIHANLLADTVTQSRPLGIITEYHQPIYCHGHALVVEEDMSIGTNNSIPS